MSSDESSKDSCTVGWVGYAADGEGFYQIPHAPIKSTTDHKTAKITIEGVQLSAAQLITELQRLIPSPNNWIWDVQEDGQDTLLLPCRRKMNCSGQSLLVEWLSKIAACILIPKFWIKIFRNS